MTYIVDAINSISLHINQKDPFNLQIQENPEIMERHRR